MLTKTKKLKKLTLNCHAKIYLIVILQYIDIVNYGTNKK